MITSMWIPCPHPHPSSHRAAVMAGCILSHVGTSCRLAIIRLVTPSRRLLFRSGLAPSAQGSRVRRHGTTLHVASMPGTRHNVADRGAGPCVPGPSWPRHCLCRCRTVGMHVSTVKHRWDDRTNLSPKMGHSWYTISCSHTTSEYAHDGSLVSLTSPRSKPYLTTPNQRGTVHN